MVKRGQTIPRRKARAISRLVRQNPSKGLNNLGSPSLIDDREFSDMLNIEFDEGGVARKRNGYTSVFTGLTAAKGLGMFSTETLKHLVTIDNGTFKYSSSGGAMTSVATVSFTAASEVVFTQARGKLYVWNGTEGGTSWDGTTLSRPGTMPKASFGIWYQDVHIVSGVPGQPNRIYISATDDASMFTRKDTDTKLQNVTEVPGATVFTDNVNPLANYIDVRKDDGDKITGLGRYQDVLLIFKERSIFQLTFTEDSNGNTTPLVQSITNSTGCVSHKSVENVENDVYFLSRDGVRVLGNEPNYFAAIRTNVLSTRIQNTMDTIQTTYYTKANGHYFDNKYILAFPTSTSAVSRTVAYDRRFQAWSVWSNVNANSFVQYVGTDNQAYLYFLDDGGTTIHRITPGTYNDNGTAINAYLTSKAFDMGNPDITKYFTDIGLVFRRIAGFVDISIYQDDGVLFGTATVGEGGNNGMGLLALGTEVLGAGSGEADTDTSFADAPFRVVLNFNSRLVQFKIQNSRLNEGFVFLGYIIAFYPSTHYLFDSSRKIYI